MKANELQINNFLQAPNVQFVIPIYQRNYDWTNTECKELLNDIISVETDNRGTHFIGSIVFIHEGVFVTSEVKELVIIDVQQRLTTINILYVALYRFARNKGNAQDVERLYNMFLTNQYVKNESSKLKLKQTDANSIAFKAILLVTDNSSLPYSNVTENYNFFRSMITEENFETILRGLNRLMFVEISFRRCGCSPSIRNATLLNEHAAMGKTPWRTLLYEYFGVVHNQCSRCKKNSLVLVGTSDGGNKYANSR